MQERSLSDALAHDQLTVRAKVFTILGQKFHVFDPAGNTVLFCQLKAFKLKEDIRLFAGEAQQHEVMAIRARSVIDFSAAYDVIDMTTSTQGTKVGALRRKGMKSMLRDAWEVLDTSDRVIGTITEDGAMKALVRRFIDAASLFMPQAFHIEIGGQEVATMKQNFNPFVRKLECSFAPGGQLDRRLGIGCAILLMAIEGRQN